ncbi:MULTISPECIES: phosphoenolpyruvate--protein phosphotransferase [unclassified Shewanella]|uniref:phosphoenolpyruvate--protein phosphotransferase n=1 Tax=unclassified Shewanella TaxID=196818 RepID=UPI001B368845|nr:phosphoenolpyruvate--protein phosphotransferase [Shewanella sp. MMG014]MBQ4888971.1 phosphoenolpyruvate--protein phosphotransferase [Shewanella sp. MMG014]
MALTGIVVSPGIAFGQAVHINLHHQHVDYRLLPVASIKSECDKAIKAIDFLAKHLKHCQVNLDTESDHFHLIDADIMLLEDEDLADELTQYITRFRFSAVVSIERIFAQHAEELAKLDDPYLANRSNDVICLGKRLMSAVNGTLQWDVSKLTDNSILLAEDITPAEFATIPLNKIKGIVLKTGGLTSHTAILAKAAGIPALLSCQFDDYDIQDGAPLILDAFSGELHVNPVAETQQQLEQKATAEKERREALLHYVDKPSVTRDGHPVCLLANVSSMSDFTQIERSGAAGVGLFRTEFLLMQVDSVPDEKQQFKQYCDALHSLNGKVLTIRTFDIGADKEIPCLTQQYEDNPALGVRGIRYSLQHQHLFTTQIKAVLRAANHGRIRLLFPMVNQIEELEFALELIDWCKQQLIEEEKGFGDLNIGIMVETPAAVLNLPHLLPRLDFVSIGSNDLTQYTLAADRGNPVLVNDYPPVSPAMIKFIKMAVDTCKIHQTKVCLCGELASDTKLISLLVGLGIDELSVNTASLLDVKATICNGQYQQFYQQAQQALGFSHIEQLNQLFS